jgi:hypothetical protein
MASDRDELALIIHKWLCRDPRFESPATLADDILRAGFAHDVIEKVRFEMRPDGLGQLGSVEITVDRGSEQDQLLRAISERSKRIRAALGEAQRG